MTTAEQYKEEIADKYIQNFKKELNLFEKIMIFPIGNRMKEILKSKKKLNINEFKDLEDLGFRRKVLGIKIFDKEIFENLTSKIFKFLKEKQEKIIQAETEGKLQELLVKIIEGKLDNLDDNVKQQEGREDQQEGREDQQEGREDQQEGREDQQEGRKDQQEGREDQQEGREDQQHGSSKHQEGWDKHSIEIGVASGMASAAAYHKAISSIEGKMGIKRLKEIPREFDGARTKEIMNNLAEQMRQHSTAKMNRVQKKVYEKSIERFEKTAKLLNGETEAAFKARQKLSDRLPPNYLETININSKVLKLIEGLPDDELIKIIGKNEDEIVKFLKIEHNIIISKDFARQLKIAKNVSEIKQITNISKNGRKLSNIVKGIKGMGVVTFLFAGLDVWSYIESNNEAELVSKINEIRGNVLKDQATMQLRIGLGTVGLEALTIVATCMAGGSMAGPRGTAVGVTIGLVAAAASMLYDNLYADKKVFYAQNRYDFINKKRTEIKQSIIQLFQSDRFHMNEGIKQSIKDDRGPNSEINTMEDAWEALIYQEEVINGNFGLLMRYYGSGKNEQDFLENLTKEEQDTYKKEKSEMEKIISIRMEYIKNYIEKNPDSEQYKKLKDAVDNVEGLLYIEKILADSKVYSYLKSDDSSPYITKYKSMSVDEYKDSYKNKLSSEYPEEFVMFEKLNKENPILLHEICRGVELSKISIASEIENIGDSQYSELEKQAIKHNIEFIERYYEYAKLGVSNERNMDLGLTGTSLDFNYIEQVLIDLNHINKRPTREKYTSMTYFSSGEIDNLTEEIDNQVSNSMFQNILYSIAREIHGYTGNNDKLKLVGFYTGDGDSTGIYMDGARKINDVTGFLFFGAKDSSIDNPDNMTKDQLLKLIVGEVDLDSGVEVADDNITREFRNRVKAIIDREYSYRESKKNYEKQIIDFIKTNNNGKTGYVEIPDNLVFNAKKAGIGDINKFLFRVENGEIYALTRGDLVNTVLHFDSSNIKINYEALNPLRSELSEHEKKVINYVDEIENKLNKLRAKQGQFLWWRGHEDDLDVPVELERIISQKSVEWNNLKESLLYMQPYPAHDYLTEKSKEYYDFFNGMYLGILNTVTDMNSFLNSNDIDNSSLFLKAAQFIGSGIVYVKDGKIEINDLVNESIKKYLPDLFEFYKDGNTGKTVKELLLSEDEREQKIGQDLARDIFELCLEESVLKFDYEGNVDSISTLDFSDIDLKKVKEKLKKGINKVGFQQIHEEYNYTVPQYEFEHSTRVIEKGESDSHKEIDLMVKNIIATMNEVDWARERKNPKFIPDKEQNQKGKITGKFSSRGYSLKITVNMTDLKNIKSITLKGLGIELDNPQEGFRTANLLNWIHNNAKKHPYGSDSTSGPGHLRYYQWSKGGDLERDVWVDMGLGGVDSPVDVDIVDGDTLRKHFYQIWKDQDFLDYINGYL